MEELWRNVKGYEGLYMVSSQGRVFSVASNRLLKITKGEGYTHVNLTKNKEVKNCYLHRIVAEAFLPNPGNLPEVNHKDGDKSNDCVDNLEWCTASENALHYWRVINPSHYRPGKAVRGVNAYDNSIIEFRSAKEACDFFGIDRSCISKAIKRHGKANGYYWEYFDPKEVEKKDEKKKDDNDNNK